MSRNIPPYVYFAAGVVLFFVLVYFFVSYILTYILPFLFAIILAALIEPLVTRMQSILRLGRGLSVAICLAIIISLLLLLLTAGVSRLFFEMDRLVRSLPEYQAALQHFEVLWDNERLQEVLDNWEFSPQLRTSLEEGLEEIYATIEGAIRNILGILQDGARRVVNFVTVTFLSFLAAYFISKDKEYLETSIMGAVPEKWREEAFSFKKELSVSIIGYIRALFILISITTILTIIGLEIFGVNYALVIGIISGILDLIPIVGPGLIFVPWIIFSFFMGEVLLGFQLILLYGTMAVVRSILEPKVIGKNIGVHPVATLVALYVGLRVFGPTGVIIGPAILIITIALIRAGIVARWRLEKG